MKEEIKNILIWVAVFSLMGGFAGFLTEYIGINCYFLFGALATIISNRLTT